jgi:hypothetical protein
MIPQCLVSLISLSLVLPLVVGVALSIANYARQWLFCSLHARAKQLVV